MADIISPDLDVAVAEVIFILRDGTERTIRFDEPKILRSEAAWQMGPGWTLDVRLQQDRANPNSRVTRATDRPGQDEPVLERFVDGDN
jgi:hypothetical protein